MQDDVIIQKVYELIYMAERRASVYVPVSLMYDVIKDHASAVFSEKKHTREDHLMADFLLGECSLENESPRRVNDILGHVGWMKTSYYPCGFDYEKSRVFAVLTDEGYDDIPELSVIWQSVDSDGEFTYAADELNVLRGIRLHEELIQHITSAAELNKGENIPVWFFIPEDKGIQLKNQMTEIHDLTVAMREL